MKYSMACKRIASRILGLSGGRTIQLFNKNNSSDTQYLISQTQFLPNAAKSTERAYCVANSLHTRPTCNSCSSYVPWDRTNRQYKMFCGRRCSQQSTHQKATETVLSRYGVSNPSNIIGVDRKKRDTCNDNNGVDYPQQSGTIRAKTLTTMQKKYGVNYPYQNNIVNTKRKQTLMDNYGVENPSHNKDIQRKKIQTNQHRYGADHFNTAQIVDALPFLLSKVWLVDQHTTQQKTVTTIATELNVNGSTVLNYMSRHGIETQHFYQSTGERELFNFIQSLGIDAISNDRTLIAPKELDIYIPSRSIAFEYCGLYWHSEQLGKDRHYHENKMRMCNELGVRLITLYEDEWLTNPVLVKSKIENILGLNKQRSVYARTTKIIKISPKQKKQFFDKYHIQGNGLGSISLGLEFGGELVACMSFSVHTTKHTLTRYATSCSVVGGFSKLLKHFTTHYEWREIVSFADRRWSDGDVYTKTGWELDSMLPPDYSYVVNGTRFHKFNFRRKYLHKRLKHFDPTLSERENCDKNGVLRVWDCGKMRFILVNR